MLEFPFPPGDQKQTGSCLCFAACAAFEYLIFKKYRQKIKLSEIFLYKQIRSLHGGTNYDSFVRYVTRTGFMDRGSRFHLQDPREIEIEEKVNLFSPSTPYILASPTKNRHGRYVVETSLFPTKEQISLYLQGGIPVITSVSNVGVENEDTTKRHAVLLIGEDGEDYIFRNSWGSLAPIFRQNKELFFRQVKYTLAIPEIILCTEGGKVKLFN